MLLSQSFALWQAKRACKDSAPQLHKGFVVISGLSGGSSGLPVGFFLEPEFPYLWTSNARGIVPGGDVFTAEGPSIASGDLGPAPSSGCIGVELVDSWALVLVRVRAEFGVLDMSLGAVLSGAVMDPGFGNYPIQRPTDCNWK